MTNISKTMRLLLVTCSLFCCVFSWGMDFDGDGTINSLDNCTEIQNGPTLPASAAHSQWNTNMGTGFGQDLIGNACDPDLNQDCIVNFQDFTVLAAALVPVSMPGSSNWNADADISGPLGVPDDVVNFHDLFRFKEFFLQPPGPSAGGECSI